jgi:hypothetical protein
LRWKLTLGILSAALAFCSPEVDSTSSATTPTSPSTEAPIPTATLQPQVIILIESDMESSAGEASVIAEEAGWHVTVQALIPSDYEPGERQTILVDFIRTSEAELAALAASGVAVVAVGRDDLQATDQMTVIDEGGNRSDQMGFLAGVLTGYATRTQRVGVIESSSSLGAEILDSGFENGLRYVCPRCRIFRLLAPETSADAFRVSGVDVVFALPGDDSLGSLAAMADDGLWTIQVGTATEATGSVRVKPDRLVAEALMLMMQGEPGQQLRLTVSNGGIEIADLDPEAFSPGRLLRVAEALEAMKAGLLGTGVSE